MRWFPCETRVSVWSPPWRPLHLPTSPVSRGGEAQPSPPAMVRTFPFSVGASQKQAELELEIARRRALGTAVTVESFLAWRAAFDAEMAAKHGPRDEDEYLGKPSGVCSFCVWEGPLIIPRHPPAFAPPSVGGASVVPFLRGACFPFRPAIVRAGKGVHCSW